MGTETTPASWQCTPMISELRKRRLEGSSELHARFHLKTKAKQKAMITASFEYCPGFFHATAVEGRLIANIWKAKQHQLVHLSQYTLAPASGSLPNFKFHKVHVYISCLSCRRPLYGIISKAPQVLFCQSVAALLEASTGLQAYLWIATLGFVTKYATADCRLQTGFLILTVSCTLW